MPLSYHKKSIKKDSDGLVYFHCSYYGKKFAGKKTANGEIFDPEKLTCAHKTLPFGTKLRITDPDTGKSVIVRVNDRGPFVKGRDLDLSRAAAEKTGLINYGVKKMQVEILD
ncbi:MAG: septal ring lytic transglycosylase RlpA family lipoprotein [Candidatus Cloacimonadota bacterium]|nr:MAG: septal ring lytic transglycosylase RlpA family lipoprotein [Candidatus Cloacimonadota bacterium]